MNITSQCMCCGSLPRLVHVICGCGMGRSLVVLPLSDGILGPHMCVALVISSGKPFNMLIYPEKFGDMNINPVKMENQLRVVRLEYTTELADRERCSSYYQCVEVNSVVKSLSLKLSAYSVIFTEVDGG